MAEPLLVFNENGIYCPPGDFYIDPWRRVERAVITHAHSDHSRWGMKRYLAHPLSIPVMKARLGADISVQALDYGISRRINGVKVSFHPAGHIPGSAQVRVEHKGQVWVASGDYKVENDGLATPFEPVACHTFISECTFGLPAFRWEAQEAVLDHMARWVRNNQERGQNSLLGCYALGKAQRLMLGLHQRGIEVWVHGAMHSMNEALRQAGLALPETPLVSAQKVPKGSLVLCPPSALGTPWMKKLGPAVLGIASGWMMLRGTRRRRAADQGFVLSDHADWPGLYAAIRATEAENIILTHGYTAPFARWLSEQGLNAQEARTEYSGEALDASPDPAEVAPSEIPTA